MRASGFTVLLLLAAPAAAARAGYELLAEFPRPGTQPLAPLLAAADGNWYTTTAQGGAFGMGTVIRITPAGAVSTLHSFSGNDGAAPVSGLTLAADGSLYGTTSGGGGGGFGTLFKITVAGAFSSVVSFTGASGAAPGSVPNQLTLHADGNFYGTTQAGGAGGWGTVFRVSPQGAVTTLLTFTGNSGAVKGASPAGPLTDHGNSLYGVTREGGAGGVGTVFSVTTAGAFSLRAEFTGTTGAKPGAHPAGGLLLHADGALYGTTEFGGANDFGTAFRLTAAGAFTSLHSFADPTGSQPAGSLAGGPDGLLYGATAGGGSSGFGTLFRMTTAGTHTVLADFTGANGATPRGGLTAGGDSYYYTATSAGGPGSAGMFCRVNAAGDFAALTGFSPATGWHPSGAPVVDGESLLFPMREGGAAGGGTLVRLAADGSFSAAAALGGTAGSSPSGALLQSGAEFIGVASRGGPADRGAVFQFSSAAVASLSPAAASTGSLAEGPLIIGNDGACYGPALEGGSSANGTLYKVSTAGVRTRLVSFTGTAGAARGRRPRAPLARAANTSYYGLTENGGAADSGTLFRLSAAGTLTTLAEFTAGGPHLPLGGLVTGTDGHLYGTTSRGGDTGGGVLLRVVPASNTWSVLASFSAATGTQPAGAVCIGSDGALYGLTTAGGTSGHGTLWRYTPAAGLEALVSFTGHSGAFPGSNSTGLPPGGVVQNAGGSLTGVTSTGGSGGGGTAFRFTFPGPLETWKLTHLGDANAPDMGDPDGDAIPNLIEYALLLPPALPNALPAVQPGHDGALSITIPRDPARSDITITVEAADSLTGPWESLASSILGAPFDGPGYVSGDDATPGPKQVQIRDTAVPGSSRRFLRTRISR
jgi:uncharacterized repeat protein (TIGR03803 family)